MEETYHRFNVDSSTISYVEMHPTGTPQGDACEVDVLKEYFANDNPPWFHKGNFGHSLVAAGFAGCKVLLSMSKDLIPGTPLGGEPIDSCVVRDNRAWPECSVKRAGLSAFGWRNDAHAILKV